MREFNPLHVSRFYIGACFKTEKFSIRVSCADIGLGGPQHVVARATWDKPHASRLGSIGEYVVTMVTWDEPHISTFQIIDLQAL